MKQIAGVVIALCLSVAPAYANIVWATFSEQYCTDRVGLFASIIGNEDYAVQWFYQNDQDGWLYIVQHGATAEVILDAIGAGVAAGGGCGST
jgi:hypothetical protein